MKRHTTQYPMGSISHGTMQAEDLIPAFLSELEYQAKRPGILPAKARKAHLKLVSEIETRVDGDSYYDSKMVTVALSGRESFADDDLSELFDALGEYAGPYFYFGSHPGDGADYGYWLSEEWDQDFDGLKVSDTSDVPRGYRGEVIHVSDHGNVTLYVKTARAMKEIWGVV